MDSQNIIVIIFISNVCIIFINTKHVTFISLIAFVTALKMCVHGR